MDMMQIIYSSQPFGFDPSILGSILIDARRCNRRDGISGALVCRQDIYLQLLEGPADKVQATFDRITQDDRHANVTVLSSTPVSTRIFGEWDMLHDPARSWLWSMEEIENGVLDRAAPADIRAVFADLSAKVDAG